MNHTTNGIYDNGGYFVGDPPGWMDQWNTTPLPEKKVIKRTTRTIERFDPQGNLIEREVITEDIEDIIVEQPVYYPSVTVSNPGDIGVSSSTVTKKQNVPYTLTNGMCVADVKI